MNNLRKGFTLIELLIVIAIIAILASVVFVTINPSDQINSAEDSKIKSTLGGIPSAAVVYYSETDDASSTGATKPQFTYTGYCSDDSVTLASEGLGGVTCRVSADNSAFVVYATLSDGTKVYCVDSEGRRDVRATAPASTAYSCQ